MDYKFKDKSAVAYDNNKKRLRTEANIILSEALNQALDAMTKDFNSSLHNGVVLELTDPSVIRKRVVKAIEWVT